MDRTRFKGQLDVLRDELVKGMIAYRVYTGILTDDQERLNAVNSLHVFFTAVAQGCRDTVYLTLSNIFDKNSQSVNIWRILNGARQAQQDVGMDLTDQDFEEIYSELALHRTAINGIRRVRNKSIAHRETIDVQSSTLGELTEVLQVAEYVLEKLYYACFAEENWYKGVRFDAACQTKIIIDLVVDYQTSRLGK